MINKTVIAHRGASGYLPEHTLAAKAMAYAMQPNYLEQDIVLSKDGIPVIIHDIHLDATTNVAEIFPNRKRKEGRYFAIDFTFEELKTLRVNERINILSGNVVFPNRFPYGKSRFGLHSLGEEIELIQGLNKSTGSSIGIYSEIKNPEFHRMEGMDISKIVLNTLNDYGYKHKDDLCMVQCFDSNELKRIRTELKSNLNLVQLMEFETEIENIHRYAEYSDAIGPDHRLLTNAKLMYFAKEHNLKVHVYTLRADELNDFNSFDDLLNYLFLDIGVDGVFTDQPNLVYAFLKKNL